MATKPDEFGRRLKTGGRQRGAKNKRTIERQERAVRAAEEMIRMRGDEGMFSGNSHEFLMSIYQDLAMPVELRADAAKAALRFEAPQTDQAPYLILTDKNLEQIDFPDGPPRFLVRMPPPVKDLDEWRAKYMPTKPNETNTSADAERAPLETPTANDEKD